MLRNLIKTNKIDFPILIDSGYKAFREFGVIALPSTIMIDRTGTVQFIYPSFPLSARQLFADEIMELVGIAKPLQEDETAKIKRSETRSHRLYRYALQMYKRGLYEQAISPLIKSIELDPNYIWSKNLKGIIFAQRGDFDNSVAAFKQAMSVDPNNVMPSFNYGVLLYENGRYGDAETQFTKSLAMNSQLAEANYFLGLVFQRTNKPDKAMEAFEKALEIDRSHESAQSRQALILYSLSELYEKKGDIAAAFDYLKKAVKEAVDTGDKTVGTISVRNRDLMLYE
jgi:Tfp pilus assembly protein PilF